MILVRLRLIFCCCFFLFSYSLVFAQDAESVKIINSNGDAFPYYEDGKLSCFDGRLIFAANDGVHGEELWISDGTEAGTSMLKDINSGPDGSRINYLFTFKDKLYFGISIGYDRALWRTDGTAIGTEIFMELNIFSGNPGGVFEYVIHEDKLFMTAEGDSDGHELWVSDGTVGGTYQVTDLYPGISGSDPQDFVSFNGLVYFVARSGFGQPSRIYYTNGKMDSVYLLTDFDQSPIEIRTVEQLSLSTEQGLLYFAAGPSFSNLEMYVSDGTKEGTRLLRDLNDDPDAGSGPSGIVNLKDKIVFSSFAGMVITDGTELNTEVLVGPGSMSNTASNWIEVAKAYEVVDDWLYFSFNSGDGSGTELWKTDGSTTGTLRIKDISDLPGSSPWDFISAKETVYFTAVSRDIGRELWRSDGLESGTQLVTDIAFEFDFNKSDPKDLTVVDSILFFTADDGANGRQLWKYTFPVTSNIPENFGEHGFTIVPNPISDYFEISGLDQDKSYMISILDVSGKSVYHKIYEDFGVEVKNLPVGVYYLLLSEGTRAFSTKLMKPK